MNTKDKSINDTQFKKLLHNDSYYKQIFKKTEKIVSVVFYILNNIDPDKKSETHISNLASKAHFVHENALRSLEIKLASSSEVLEQFAQALIALDSTLRVTTVGGVLTEDVLSVLTAEIDTVLRGLRTYLQDSGLHTSGFFDQLATPLTQSSSAASSPARSTTTSRSSRPTTTATPTVSGGGVDRKERIRTILEAKGEATIKDISEIITDCSEKTIQRELNAMIAENSVQRQGERRWSRYSVI